MLKRVTDNFIPIDLDQMRLPGFLEKRAKEIAKCIDNVAKGKGWKNMPACPLCSNIKRKTLFSRYGIAIVQCGNCGVGYPEKFPVDSKDVYCDKCYLPIAKSSYLDNSDYRKRRFAKERLDLIKAHLSSPEGETSILDVGCGTGWFLEAAKDLGYKTYGQELGRELARFTEQRLGIRVWSEPFTDLTTDETFDCITLFDVIEHVSNPAQVIKSVERRLNAGGICLIFTPNLESLAFWKLKELSSLVMPAEHLFYFTEKSLRMMVEKTELKIIDFTTKGMDIPDIYSYYRDTEGNKQVAEFLKEHCSELQAIIDEAKCANHMRFILRKKEEAKV